MSIGTKFIQKCITHYEFWLPQVCTQSSIKNDFTFRSKRNSWYGEIFSNIKSPPVCHWKNRVPEYNLPRSPLQHRFITLLNVTNCGSGAHVHFFGSVCCAKSKLNEMNYFFKKYANSISSLWRSCYVIQAAITHWSPGNLNTILDKQSSS